MGGFNQRERRSEAYRVSVDEIPEHVSLALNRRSRRIDGEAVLGNLAGRVMWFRVLASKVWLHEGQAGAAVGRVPCGTHLWRRLTCFQESGVIARLHFGQERSGIRQGHAEGRRGHGRGGTDVPKRPYGTQSTLGAISCERARVQLTVPHAIFEVSILRRQPCFARLGTIGAHAQA